MGFIFIEGMPVLRQVTSAQQQEEMEMCSVALLPAFIWQDKQLNHAHTISNLRENKGGEVRCQFYHSEITKKN
jgi:hypothetical protein